MGTRCDFYIGRGISSEWLGSLGFDGYPGNKAFLSIFISTDEQEYRAEVTKMFSQEDNATIPEQGWPWPWKDSKDTDYAYTFIRDRVYGACFGHGWFDPLLVTKEISGDDLYNNNPEVEFPDMSDRQNIALDNRSGLIFIEKI